MDHSVSRSARWRPWILEEGDVRARRPALVGIEEVVDGRIVLVDGLLDHPETERAGVELDVARRVPGDGGDVVDAFELHGLSSLLRAQQYSTAMSDRKPG